MKQLLSVTSDAWQTQKLQLEDGTFFQLEIIFYELQQGWFINNLTYGAFQLRGVRICNSPNMLHQFINQIPFGLACFSTDDLEPQIKNSFSSGTSQMYLLDQVDTEAYADFLIGDA